MFLDDGILMLKNVEQNQLGDCFTDFDAATTRKKGAMNPIVRPGAPEVKMIPSSAHSCGSNSQKHMPVIAQTELDTRNLETNTQSYNLPTKGNALLLCGLCVC